MSTTSFFVTLQYVKMELLGLEKLKICVPEAPTSIEVVWALKVAEG
jgi:hypothetical protein